MSERQRIIRAVQHIKRDSKGRFGKVVKFGQTEAFCTIEGDTWYITRDINDTVKFSKHGL